MWLTNKCYRNETNGCCCVWLTGIWKYDWYLRSATSIHRLVRSTSALKHLLTTNTNNNTQIMTGIEVNSEANFPKLREYCPSANGMRATIKVNGKPRIFFRFPIGRPLQPYAYLAPLLRYGTSNILGSWPWPFGVAWRHRGNHSRPKHVIQCKKYGDTPKMCSPEHGKKLQQRKKERQNNPHLNIIFHPFTGPALQGRLLQFLACGVTPPRQSSVSNFKSIALGVRGLWVPKKSGVSHWLWSSPLQQCTVLAGRTG